MIPWLAWVAIALAMGSTPFGLIIARAKGVDIRAQGSGNIGATNVARVLGLRLGLLCFFLDLCKGLIPTLAYAISEGLLGAAELEAAQSWRWIGVWIAPILGHMFSPFVRFRGGKGVATALGSMLGVYPFLALPALIALGVWILIVWRWRMVGIASCIAAVVIPFSILLGVGNSGPLSNSAPFLIVTTALGLLVIFKHRKNLARTFAGTETKVGRPRPSESPRPGQ